MTCAQAAIKALLILYLDARLLRSCVLDFVV